jgi:hypothetical protein
MFHNSGFSLAGLVNIAWKFNILQYPPQKKTNTYVKIQIWRQEFCVCFEGEYVKQLVQV